MKKKFVRYSFKDLAICTIILASLFLSFIAGFVSGDAQVEKTAQSISTYVIDNTEKSRYLGIIVKKSEEGSIFGTDSNDHEFRNVYGIFKQQRATFATGFNFNKSEEIHIDEFEESENYSIFSLGQPQFGKYEDKNNNIYGYIHEPFPLIFTSKLQRDESKTRYCVSISRTKANKLLKIDHPDREESSFTYKDYDDEVIGKKELHINVNGLTRNYLIQGVYLDDENHYYYSCLKETINDFVVFTDSNYPTYGDEKKCTQERMYFFTDYTYQNKFYIDYLNELYQSDDYIVEFAKNNIVKNREEVDVYLSFRDYRANVKPPYLENALVVICFLLLAAAIALMIVFKTYKNYFGSIIIAPCLFLPYVVFKILFVTSKNILYMSGFGSMINGILIILYGVSLIAFTVYQVIKIKKKEKYEEINI